MSESMDGSKLSYSLNSKWAQTHRPECVSAIGLIVLSWNRTEEQLAWTLSGIMGVTLIGDSQTSINHDWLMSTIMAETNTVHARIKIADAIFQKAFDGHPLKATWTGIRLRLRQLADKRNIVVHSRWAWSEQHPDYLLQVGDNHATFRWNEQHFLDIADAIKSLEDDLHSLMLSVANELSAGTLRSGYLKPKRIDAF